MHKNFLNDAIPDIAQVLNQTNLDCKKSSAEIWRRFTAELPKNSRYKLMKLNTVARAKRASFHFAFDSETIKLYFISLLRLAAKYILILSSESSIERWFIIFITYSLGNYYIFINKLSLYVLAQFGHNHLKCSLMIWCQAWARPPADIKSAKWHAFAGALSSKEGMFTHKSAKQVCITYHQHWAKW